MNAQIMRDISQKLDTAVGLLEEIHEILAADKQPSEQIGSVDPHPWLTKMLEFEGHDEVDHNAELAAFLGIDPEETPWCAAMLSKCLEFSGKPALGLRARDYIAYGEEGDGSVGDIAVWRSHVGVVCDDDGNVIGGNVSNMVKKSPPAGSEKDWFRNFIGFRRVV